MGEDFDDLISPHAPLTGIQTQCPLIGMMAVDKGHHGAITVAVQTISMGQRLEVWIELYALLRGEAQRFIHGLGSTNRFQPQKDYIARTQAGNKPDQVFEVVEIGTGDHTVHPHRDAVARQ